MPLNRLHVRHIDYPNTKDAIAMVSKLEYVEKYDTALRYILAENTHRFFLGGISFRKGWWLIRFLAQNVNPGGYKEMSSILADQ
jgi:hypothetical protein